MCIVIFLDGRWEKTWVEWLSNKCCNKNAYTEIQTQLGRTFLYLNNLSFALPCTQLESVRVRPFASRPPPSPPACPPACKLGSADLPPIARYTSAYCLWITLQTILPFSQIFILELLLHTAYVHIHQLCVYSIYFYHLQYTVTSGSHAGASDLSMEVETEPEKRPSTTTVSGIQNPLSLVASEHHPT